MSLCILLTLKNKPNERTMVNLAKSIMQAVFLNRACWDVFLPSLADKTLQGAFHGTEFCSWTASHTALD